MAQNKQLSKQILEKLLVVNEFYNLLEVRNIMLMVSVGVYFVSRFSSYYLVPRHNTLHIKIVEICTSIESDSTGIQSTLLAVWVYLPPSTASQLLYIFERHCRIYSHMFGNIKYYNHRSMYISTARTQSRMLIVFSFSPLFCKIW